MKLSSICNSLIVILVRWFSPKSTIYFFPLLCKVYLHLVKLMLSLWHVIFLFLFADSSNSDSVEDTSIDDSKPILKHLCQNISAPIYTFHIQTSTSDRTFCCPPKPGILAFLQRLHLLNLFHKHTLYLHCTEAHTKMAEEAGVRHSPARNILCNPQMVVKPRCAIKVAVKLELKNIEVKQRVEGQRSSPMIPMFSDAKEAEVNEDWIYSQESVPWKYTHGVCFRNGDILERYSSFSF